MYVGKIWGSTESILQNSMVELHRVCIKKGFRCSKHLHNHKWNGFFVVSGALKIHVFKNDYDLVDVTELFDGDFTAVAPGEYHYFEAEEDTEALELYWAEPLSQDIVRETCGGKAELEGQDKEGTVTTTHVAKIGVEETARLTPGLYGEPATPGCPLSPDIRDGV